MGSIKLTINDRQIEASDGATVYEAAKEAGIYIPSFCNYPGLQPLSKEQPDRACQMCLVEINGEMTLSCSLNVSEGMVVKTDTPQVRDQQKKNLKAILRRHPHACLTCHRLKRCGPFDICLRHVSVGERCVICPKNGNCDLQKAADYIGLVEEDVIPSTYTSKQLPIRTDSPFFVRDNNLCILCERCVRVCRDVVGAKILEFSYPCHNACPAHIDIPRYVRLIARGRPSAALSVVRERIPFPGSIGRVCIHPCEQACQRGKAVDEPLWIRMLKRYSDDNTDDSWKSRGKKLPDTGKKVAVVGAGPAGLTVALYLAKQGHKVTVFEALPVAGGMMRVGIPEYRLPRDIMNREVEYIESVGVEIKYNTRIEDVDALFNDGFNAVFLGIGAHTGMKLGLDGEDLPGVIDSAAFLLKVNLHEKVDVGEKVGVVGGGNVAIDAARVSPRIGAKKVTIFYRRTRAEMPAAVEEIDAALEEGIEIIYLAAPTKVTRGENGKLQFECQRMELGEPDASGRRRPVPIEGSEFVTELDTLIAAIGQRPNVSEGFGVETGRGNTIPVNENMMTSREGVFSAGDCQTGPGAAIQAIAGARQAAECIDRYLGGTGDISESLVGPEESTHWLNGNLPQEEKLAHLSHMSPEKSITTFEECEYGFDHETAMAEAMRCLQCHVIEPKSDIILQEAACQSCSACVDACPVGALVKYPSPLESKSLA